MYPILRKARKVEVTVLMRTFIQQAKDDPRIGPMHLGLYLAVLSLWSTQTAGSSVEISARKLMPLAKIGGSRSYHRSIRQLHEYGYLKYEPSCDPEVPSRIYLDANTAASPRPRP